MKKIALAAAMSVAATGAFAGGIVQAPAPMMEAPMVVEESAPGSARFVIPALVAAAVIAAVAVHHHD